MEKPEMNTVKAITIATVASLIFSANVFAMSGLDFIKLDDATAQRKALEPIIYQFVKDGYKNIPDWPALSNRVREFVLKNGAGNKPLSSIAEEAAKLSGMSL